MGVAAACLEIKHLRKESGRDAQYAKDEFFK